MKDRIQYLLNALNLSATRLADEINVQRSGISHILSGRNQPSYDFLSKLLVRYPEINADWLLLGRGNAFSSPTIDESTVKSDPPPVYGKSALQGNLFSEKTDNFSNHAPKSALQMETTNQVTNVSYVTRIILLYSDGGYEIFDQPRNINERIGK